MEREIREAINQVLEELKLSSGGFVVEHPADESHGDYATNVAMTLSGNPREVAEKIVLGLRKDEGLVDIVAEISVAGPGFINFRLKESWLIGEMKRVDGDYGKGEWGRGKKILVEYSSPNIAKNFSVGHLRSTIIGQAIYNLYQFGGWEVIGDNHWGDWGTQFGMIIAAVEEQSLDVGKLSVEEIERVYVDFNKRAKEDEGLRDKAKAAFKRLENGEKEARNIWQQVKELSVREFDRIYELLGVKIDHAYGESDYEEVMPGVIEEAKKKGITRESEGAVIIEFEKMPPAMLVKSDGTTTYFTRDLATIKFRGGKFGADRYVYEVGAEQSLHFQQVFAAAEKMGWGKKEDYVHVAHGLVLGEDGKKMSTRKGTGVKMEEWLKQSIEKAGKINKGSEKEVGIGAVKFFDLKHAPVTSYRFSWDEALRLDGDSGPYVQYALVRGKSVLEKGKLGEFETSELNEEERALLRWLYQFAEVAERAAVNYAPNLLAEYLLELAKRFNGFYNKHQIVGSEVEGFRLKMTGAVVTVLESGLGLLGVEISEKM